MVPVELLKQKLEELGVSLRQGAAALNDADLDDDDADLDKLKASMKTLIADVNGFLAATAGLSDSTSTITDFEVLTPGTSVAGDATPTTEGPVLEVPPGPRVPYKLNLAVRKNSKSALM